MLKYILIISLYLFPLVKSIPKTSQETGNDIEAFLMEKQERGLLPVPANTNNTTTSSSSKRPDKFMEDLIEVQRTYRNLKKRWQRIMEEKSEVMRLASDVPPTTTTTSTIATLDPGPLKPVEPLESNIQEIDVDVFEAPDKFQDISEPSEFDDVAFVDISSSSSGPHNLTLVQVQNSTQNPSSKPSELEEIQNAIREAFGTSVNEVQKALINVGGAKVVPKLEEIIGVTRNGSFGDSDLETQSQQDGASSHVKVDHSTSSTSSTTAPSTTSSTQATSTTLLSTPLPIPTTPEASRIPHTLLDPRAHPSASKSLISTFGSPPGPQHHPRSPIRPQVATEWRRQFPRSQQEFDSLGEAVPESEAEGEDPFDVILTRTNPTVPSTVWSTVPPPATVPTSTTSIPPHILPESKFVSSGVLTNSDPDSSANLNFFRYPDHVQIPFFGSQTVDVPSSEVEVRRPTTPEPSGEVAEEVEEEEEEEEVPMSEGEESESDYESEDVEEITITTTTTTTTPIPIDKNEDYVEETFSQETPDSKTQNFEEAIQKSQIQEIPRSFGIGKAPEAFPDDLKEPGGFLDSEDSSETLGGSFGGSFGIGKAPEPPTPLDAVERLLESNGREIGPPGSLSGIGRSPPGSESTSETSEVARPSEAHGTPTFGSKNGPKEFPTLISQEVENFFAEDSESAASVANIPVQQHLEVLEDPMIPKVPETTRKPKIKIPRPPQQPIGIFNTQNSKITSLNQKAYRPPMFPSPMSSLSVQMTPPGNPYLTRTTIPPIGPHGLAERPTNEVINSVDMELPALGMDRDNGIMNRARREYQKQFEQQIRDVKMIDEEIVKISQINEDGRSKSGQRCSQIYAHTLSLSQIQQMSSSLGLGDVAAVIKKASDLTTNYRKEEDISKLEVDLEDKRRLIAKVEILLSLAESRALLFDLLKEQKKIVEKMENRALDLLEKTNFRPTVTPSPFSAASDISELSSAVKQVLGGSQKRGWSMMKKKTLAAGKKPNFQVIPLPETHTAHVVKTGHLQETAEIVEPVLPGPASGPGQLLLQNDHFGRQPVPAPVIIHRRPLPMAPPTMSPMAFSFARPAQRAAHHLTATQPITPPRFTPPTDDEVIESETVHELIDMLHEDIVKLPEDEQDNICRQVQCDFEKADLCNFESSHDETTRLAKKRVQKLRKRDKREVDLLEEQTNISDDLLPYTFRAWSIWAGRKADRQKQIDIGPDFSPRNTHFAAVFLEPQQAGILSVPLILSGTSTRIRLRLFEGSRGIRLRVCCDRWCPLETEPGLYRGHRMWLRKTVTCPANTQTLSFECLNDGPDRGACGVDEVFVDSSRCHRFFQEGDQS